MSDDDKAAETIRRLQHRAFNALRCVRDESKSKMVRDVAGGYLDLYRNHVTYLRAAFQNRNVRQWIEDDSKSLLKFDMAEFMVRVPAIWEFEFTRVVGDVEDAMWCIGQYGTTRSGKPKWIRFIGVSPMTVDAPHGGPYIAILHKENSPFRIGLENRDRLKRMIGSQYRPLVNAARGMTKTEFIEQFYATRGVPIKKTDRKGDWYTVNKRVPDMPDWLLLQRTGYTPEELWREVNFMKRNNGQHVPSKRPQLQFFDENRA